LGIVEECSPRRILGWVEWDGPSDDREICIKLNGVEVARAVACRTVMVNGESKPFGFARHLPELFSFVGPQDEITIEHKGQALPIVGCGLKYIPKTEGRLPSSALLSKLKKGFIFTSYGKLNKPLNARSEFQKGFIEELADLQHAVSDALGLELFITYGTLLGCVREGDFIAHDQDFDLTYISRHTSPEAVKAENIEFCKFLISRGYRGVVHKHCFGVNRPVRFDVYYSWFADDGRFQTSFGYHGKEAQRNKSFFEFEERQLGDFTVRVPLAAREILAQLYGDTWRIPDPGFSHYAQQTKQQTRKFDPAYLLDDEYVRAMHWHQFYILNEQPDPTPFADFVLRSIPAPDLILDVGCGTGRDTIHFSRSGIPAVGIDASPAAIQQAERQRMAAKMPCRFIIADLGRADEISAVLASFPPVNALVVYLRFFFHSVPEELEDRLLSALTQQFASFTLAAEFRTEQPQPGAKRHYHYRRCIDPDSFQAKLEERYGFVVRHREESFGFSALNGDDPHLCRMIAVRE
jgi:hypothetical protein